MHNVGKTSEVHRAVVKAYLWSLPMTDGDCGDDCNDNCHGGKTFTVHSHM